MEYIFQVIKSYPSGDQFTEEMIEFIRQRMEPIVMNTGDIADNNPVGSEHLYFVETGLIREIYFKNRKAVSRSFKKPGQFIVSSRPYDSDFITNTDASSMIEALENSVVWLIPSPAMRALFATFPDANTIHIDIIMRAAMIDKNHYQISGLRTHRERFNYMRKNLPDLLQRIEPKYLASFSAIPVEKLTKMHQEWKLKEEN